MIQPTISLVVIWDSGVGRARLARQFTGGWADLSIPPTRALSINGLATR
jgi:hypothetical protein